MSFNPKDVAIYREDEKSGHKLLQAKQREELVNRYLPAPGRRSRSNSRQRKQETSWFGTRKLVRQQLYVLCYTIIHALFSVYIRIRIAWHAVVHQILSVIRYHHRTPDYIRRDVSSFRRLPGHISVILTLEKGGKKADAIEKLINEVADIAAWCASAEIPFLTVYERTGVLKNRMPHTHHIVDEKLREWFGRYHSPSLHMHTRGAAPVHPWNFQPRHFARDDEEPPRLEIKLISEEDGREAMVDLTKVLTEMAQRSKITPAEITVDVIDNELSNAVSAEPDLLISFAPFVDLQGYPPWQIRLTEIFCMPDNQEVGYQVFLAGLRSYAGATFKMGK